jgi:hypothetical protein
VLAGLANLAADGAPNSPVRMFDGRPCLTDLIPGGLMTRLVIAQAKWKKIDPVDRVPSLPECWIWLSNKYLGLSSTIADSDSGSRLFQETTVDMVDKLTATDRHRDHLSLDDALRNDELRVLTVSRSRYNSRYRGQLVTSRSALTNILLHSAICVARSRAVPASDVADTWTLPPSASHSGCVEADLAI